MANLEERITTLEENRESHTRAIEAVRQDIAGLRVELRTEVAAIRGEMALRSDVAALRAEMADLRREMVAGDAALRSEINELRSEMNRRFDMMDKKFLWLAGTQVATLLAVVGVLAGTLYR